MDNTDYEALKEKLDELTIRNKRLEKDNRNMIKSIRHYKRVIKDYKVKLEQQKEKNDKQHFRKGRKRGSHQNGRNG
jgi:hypothetical protein